MTCVVFRCMPLITTRAVGKIASKRHLGERLVRNWDGEDVFVVIREIEGEWRDCRVFSSRHEAEEYYEDAAWVCWNEPDSTPGGDPSIVTNCWLREVEAYSGHIAELKAMRGDGVLLATCFTPTLSFA